MQEIIENNNENLNFTDKDIFRKIWTSPRKVFKYINEKHYDKYVTMLLILSGISNAFDRASMKNMGDTMPIETIIGLSILIGGLLGWISFYFYAALLSWTGKWLNGKSNTTAIIRIISYAMIPSIIALVFLIPQIAIYGVEIFKEDGDITSAGLISNIFVYVSAFLESILGIWTLILCIIGISEVQKFSIGKAILNIILPVFVILIPIAIIVLLFQSFS